MRHTAFAGRVGAVGCVLIAMGGVALAQATGAANPSPAPAAPSKDEPPPGACMPIGLTVSGEVVFPIQCKDFIERLKAGDQKPAAEGADPTKPPAKPVAKQSEGAESDKAKQENAKQDNSKPAAERAETAASPKRVQREGRQRATSSAACTHFRSYDAASGSYTSYDGKVRPCP